MIIFISSPAFALKIQNIVSLGGVKAWLVETYEVPIINMPIINMPIINMPIINMNVSWAGGSAAEPIDKAGISDMVAMLLSEGADDYKERLQAIGAKINFSVNADYFEANLATLAENSDAAFSLFELAINQSSFNTDKIINSKTRLKSIYNKQISNAKWLALNNWYKAAYGNHPYVILPLEIKTIDAISRQDLIDHTKNMLARDNMNIVVTGAINAKNLGVLLDKTFSGLPAQANLPIVPQAKIATAEKIVIIKRPFEQSVIYFGLAGISYVDPDFYAAYLMNHILGGEEFSQPSSRLFQEIREKRGLAYSIFTALDDKRHASILLGRVGTKNVSAGKVLALIKEELNKIATSGVSDNQLRMAKLSVIGSYPLSFMSNQGISNMLIAIQRDGLGIDYIDRRAAMIEAVKASD